MIGKLDVTKISYHAFMYCTDQYVLLDSGSALGTNCGPILIKKDKTDFSESSRIAIPGKYTTANMLLDIAYPLHQNRVEFLLSVVIYTNQNETFNDDIYEYNELSIPFLARFGKKIYEYELLRPKKNLPDLTRYNLGSW